jgi:hypothetical protein
MSTCFLSVLVTVSVQVVHFPVVQHIIVTFLTNESVKPAEILFILGTQLDYKMLSRFHVCNWSK